ncbi:MAG: phosphoenolpyruvate--protein phosphotransferase [Spirochaetota bacterium]|jgi:phosphotransferase system enzyme I (PtsI)|nr:phosphoenolpyruvate--protein phosphotransferase [Spirochaetota bacterium]
MATAKKKERILDLGDAIIASPGIAIGTSVIFSDDIHYTPEYTIMRSQIDDELMRLNAAIEKARQDLIGRQEDLSKHFGKSVELLDPMLKMLSDPALHRDIRALMEKRLTNIEVIFAQVIDSWVDKFVTSGDRYFRERSEDLKHLKNQVMLILLGRTENNLRNLSEDTVIIANTLSPTQTAAMDMRYVKGIVTEIGGKTSHSAILARALEIPTIVSADDITRVVPSGVPVILDAIHGRLIVHPSAANLKEYKTARSVHRRFINKLRSIDDLPALTKDKTKVIVSSNIGIVEEMDAASASGIDGIGLFRSEFLFVEREEFANEEEQYGIYCAILQKMGKLPVVIRTIDFGSDKPSPEHRHYFEANPALGWRSIRFCLSMPEIFKTQLRALYRASVHGNLEIMIPMISSVEELTMTRRIIDGVKRDLAREGYAFRDDVPFGVMIELPVAVLMADELARHCQFFSIGTNDLVQYALGVDRANRKVAHLYKHSHPAILKFISMTIEAAARRGIPVSMCGEMASDALFTELLLGMGLRHFSMSTGYMRSVKKIIRSTTISECEQIAAKVLSLTQTTQVDAFLLNRVREQYPDSFDKL